MDPEAGEKGRPVAPFPVPQFPAVPDVRGPAEPQLRAGRTEPAAPGFRDAGGPQPRCARRVLLSPEGFAQRRGSRRSLELTLPSGSVWGFFRGNGPPSPPFPQPRPFLAALPSLSFLQPATIPGRAGRSPRSGPPLELPRCLGVPTPSRFCVLWEPKTSSGAGAKRKLGAGGAAARRRAPS